MKTNRYLVTTSFYIYAADNDKAVKLAQKITEKQNEKHDCSAVMERINTATTGTVLNCLVFHLGIRYDK